MWEGIPLSEGDRVVALLPIREQGFPKPGNLHTHAEKGEYGTVVYVDPDDNWPTVRFDRSGTAAIVGESECSKIRLDEV